MADTNSFDNLTQKNFEIVRAYINTGDSKALSTETKDMLDKCVECYGLLRKFPQRNICIKKFKALHHGQMTDKTAAHYVDFARKTWGNYIDVSREFLDAYFLDKLLSEISNPKASEACRAKNLATLQKYISSMPDKTIDPTLMEANQIYIQVNVGNKNFSIPEKLLNSLEPAQRELFINSIENNIDDAGSEQILDS